MKSKALIVFAALTAFAAASQDSVVHLSRHFTSGEVDVYKLHMTGTTMLGDIEANVTTKQTVNKLLDDGGANVTMDLVDFHVVVNGMEIPLPPSPSKSYEVDKNGIPKVASDDMSSRFNFLRDNMPYFDHDWKPGDTMNVDVKATDKSAGTTGTVKFVGVNDGDAEFDSSLTITPTGGDASFKLVAKTNINVANSQLDTIEGTVDRLPIQQGVELSDVKLSLTRVKTPTQQ